MFGRTYNHQSCLFASQELTKDKKNIKSEKVHKTYVLVGWSCQGEISPSRLSDLRAETHALLSQVELGKPTTWMEKLSHPGAGAVEEKHLSVVLPAAAIIHYHTLSGYHKLLLVISWRSEGQAVSRVDKDCMELQDLRDDPWGDLWLRNFHLLLVVHIPCSSLFFFKTKNGKTSFSYIWITLTKHRVLHWGSSDDLLLVIRSAKQQPTFSLRPSSQFITKHSTATDSGV